MSTLGAPFLTLTNFGTANTAEEEDFWIFSSDFPAVSKFVHFIKVRNKRVLQAVISLELICTIINVP